MTMGQFTPRVQQLLAVARCEAKRLGCNYVGTEHLVLGLIELGKTQHSVALPRLGIDIETEQLKAEIEKEVGFGDVNMTSESLPYTPRVKKVLALANKEAQSMGTPYVGTHHVMLGILRDGEGMVAKILFRHGVRADKYREKIRPKGLGDTVVAAMEHAAAEETPDGLLEAAETLWKESGAKMFHLGSDLFVSHMRRFAGRFTDEIRELKDILQRKTDRLRESHETTARLMKVVSECDRILGGSGTPSSPEDVLRKLRSWPNQVGYSHFCTGKPRVDRFEICVPDGDCNENMHYCRWETEDKEFSLDDGTRVPLGKVSRWRVSLVDMRDIGVHNINDSVCASIKQHSENVRNEIHKHGARMEQRYDFQKWWMVFNSFPRGMKPQTRHDTFKEAHEEAQRIANKERNKVHVLEKVATCYPVEHKPTPERRCIEETIKYDEQGNVASKVLKFNDGTNVGMGV